MNYPIADLIAAPTRFFQWLSESRVWIFPVLVLLIVFSLAYGITSGIMVDFAREAALESADSADARESIENVFDKSWLRIALIAAPSLSHLMAVLILTAIALLITSLTGGTSTRRPFLMLLCIGLWAKLVAVPHMILWTPLALMKETPEIYFGPAAFLTGDSTDKLFRFLAAFDIFNLWYIALFVIGAKVCLSISTVRAALAVLTPWLIWHVVTSSLA